MCPLGSASNNSNAHDRNDRIRSRVTEPVLFEIGPSHHGTAARGGSSSSPEEGHREGESVRRHD